MKITKNLLHNQNFVLSKKESKKIFNKFNLKVLLGLKKDSKDIMNYYFIGDPDNVNLLFSILFRIGINSVFGLLFFLLLVTNFGLAITILLIALFLYKSHFLHKKGFYIIRVGVLDVINNQNFNNVGNGVFKNESYALIVKNIYENNGKSST